MFIPDFPLRDHPLTDHLLLGHLLGHTARRAVCFTLLICFVLLSPASNANWRASWPSSVDLSGFGTVGYATLDNDTARYRVGLGRDGTTSAGSFGLDSRLGLQVDADIVRFLTGTAQVLAREDPQGDFDPRVELAFLKYRLSHIYSVRGGVLSLPIFMLSDSREVGYTTPYLRPPEDLYVQIPIRNFRGADILADLSLGDWYINAQGFAGISKDKLSGNVQSRSEGVGVNVSAEYSNLRFRLSQLIADTSSESANLEQIRAGLVQAVQVAPDAAGLLRDFNKGSRDNPASTNWTALGFALDFDRFFIDAEYAWLRFDNWIPDTASWYVSAGYRYGNFTPYALVAATREVDRPDPVTFPDTPELNALTAGIAAFTTDPGQDTAALGVRWDFAPKLAFKFQVDRIERKDRGISFRDLSTVSSEDNGQGITLFSATVDFVF